MTHSVRKLARNTTVACLITTGMGAAAWQEYTWREGVTGTQGQFQEHKEKQAATEAVLATSVDLLTRQVEVLAQILQDQQETQRSLIRKVYETLADVRQAPCYVDTPRSTE